MKNNSQQNQSVSGWHCSHCGAFNKVIGAKFCGKCGSVKETKPIQPVLKAELPQKSQTAKAKTFIRKAYKFFKLFIYPSRKRLYKRVIAGAVFLLIISVIAGYKMYTNVNTIRLSKARFSDVSIDHPVYSVCKNMLGIDAISFRKNLELAPYENISASEWNHALNQASKYLNQKYSTTAYFSKNDPISVDSLNIKLRAIKANSSEITDTSRIQSFYILEQTLFN